MFEVSYKEQGRRWVVKARFGLNDEVRALRYLAKRSERKHRPARRWRIRYVVDRGRRRLRLETDTTSYSDESCDEQE